MVPPRLASLVVVLLCAGAGCGPNGQDDGEDARAEADAAPEADVPEEDVRPDVEDDPEAEPVPGPLAAVFREAYFVEDRLCDFDGDGVGENAVADLGTTSAQVLLLAVNAMVRGNIEQHGSRIAGYFPWIDDLSVPAAEDARLVVFNATDDETPRDPEDDFTGEETFFVHPSSLDACGEPRYVFPSARIDAGRLVASGGLFPIAVGLELAARDAQITGTYEPFGASGEVLCCGQIPIHDMGDVAGLTELGDLTLLEALTAGGTALGAPTIAGVSPNLDVDHDGLERILLDEQMHVASCVDGDSTTYEGPDCWQRPEMADAFVLTLGGRVVRAQFGGRQNGWESDPAIVGTCDGGPPEHSLFDR